MNGKGSLVWLTGAGMPARRALQNSAGQVGDLTGPVPIQDLHGRCCAGSIHNFWSHSGTSEGNPRYPDNCKECNALICCCKATVQSKLSCYKEHEVVLQALAKEHLALQ
eukprot:scaffold230377_cov48-Prasinocladus_malaysianus.AAC.1